ncbi:MAG: hypothetical protein LBQ12_02880, partial [Deltaproteobacteria bacterium]|nr:hypothetical protein [Deltaproteobacteria bacterium]
GLFGDGEALVQAVVTASCLGSPKAAPLSSFEAESGNLRRRAGTPESPGPYCARLAVALIDADAVSRSSEWPELQFQEFADLCPPFPETAEGPLAASQAAEPGGDPPRASELPLTGGSEARELFMFAYCAALAVVAWETARGTRNLDFRRSTLFSLPGLINALPNRVRRDRLFLGEILPGSIYTASDGVGGDGDSGLMSEVCSPEYGVGLGRHPQIRGCVALKAWANIALSYDFQTPVLSLTGAHLEGPLPPYHRAMLVSALCVGMGSMGICDAMMRCFFDNCMMVLERDPGDPFPEGQHWDGFPDDASARVSWKAKADDYSRWDGAASAADGGAGQKPDGSQKPAQNSEAHRKPAVAAEPAAGTQAPADDAAVTRRPPLAPRVSAGPWARGAGQGPSARGLGDLAAALRMAAGRVLNKMSGEAGAPAPVFSAVPAPVDAQFWMDADAAAAALVTAQRLDEAERIRDFVLWSSTFNVSSEVKPLFGHLLDGFSSDYDEDDEYDDNEDDEDDEDEEDEDEGEDEDEDYDDDDFGWPTGGDPDWPFPGDGARPVPLTDASHFPIAAISYFLAAGGRDNEALEFLLRDRSPGDLSRFKAAAMARVLGELGAGLGSESKAKILELVAEYERADGERPSTLAACHRARKALGPQPGVSQARPAPSKKSRKPRQGGKGGGKRR